MRATIFIGVLMLCASPVTAQITCGTADDTTAIQQAIDEARTIFDPVAPVQVVQLPPGPCYVSSLNMTARAGIMLRGPSLLIPITSGSVVLDLSGSAAITLRDIRIGGQNNLGHSTGVQGTVPRLGILISQIAGPLDGWSNKIILDTVQVDGEYSVGTVFILGVPSSQILNSQFTQFYPSPNVWITGNWWWDSMSPYQTMVAHATSLPTDWTITGTEFHNFAQQAGLWIGAAQDIRIYGGNISAKGFVAVDINAVSFEGQGIGPARIILDGTTFYSDSGVQGPCAVRGAEGVVSFRANFHSQPSLTC